MNRRTLASATSLALAALLGFSSCASSSKQSVALRQVDGVLEHIERVRHESQASQQAVRAARDWLHAIYERDFGGDVVTAYAKFVEAIERSEEQAEELRDSVAPMKNAAEDFFEEWSNDLTAFASPEIRQLSETRLEDTRARYQDILTVVEPAQSVFDAFNIGLRDSAIYLGNDYNLASVSELEGVVRGLTERALDLDRSFDAGRVAAETYIMSAALPGRVHTNTEAEE